MHTPTTSKRNSRNLTGSHRQSGVVLVMTLIILLIVTLLGTSSVQLTGLLERMSRNAADSSTALAAAETALKAAEAIVEAETNLSDYELNANGKYEMLAPGASPRWLNNAFWDASNTRTASYSLGAQQPQYFIEFAKTVLSEEDRLNLDNVGGDTGVDRTQIFRITALGFGRTSSARVYLQSTYGKKF